MRRIRFFRNGPNPTKRWGWGHVPKYRYVEGGSFHPTGQKIRLLWLGPLFVLIGAK